MDKKKKTTEIVAKQETNLAEINETNVLDMLDQASMSSKQVGMATIKAKAIKEWDKTRLFLERRQWELTKEVDEELRVRVILSTEQYQLSAKNGDNFSTVAVTSEVFNWNQWLKIYNFLLQEKLYHEIPDMQHFTKLYPKDTLKKNEELKRYKIVYLETQWGIAKMYLKPSQYVGCFLEKSWYRYNNPMEETLGSIEKKYPVKWYNRTFKLEAKSYEKNWFTITYPAFTDPQEDDFDPTTATKYFNEIVWGIRAWEQARIESGERDKKFIWEW